MDLEKLRSIFIDEAMEQASVFEEGLLQIEKSPQDKELLNTIFRSIHTIKGASGTLGFTDISRFTHVMEELLDLMRQERLAVERETIDVLLRATDLIKEMIEAVASGSDFDSTKCEGLVTEMEELKRLQTKRTYRVLFRPGPDLFRRGLDPLVILDGLREIGEVTMRADTDAVPPLSEMDPEELYLRWEMELKTERDPAEIEKVFEFAMDGGDVKIIPVAASEEEVPLLGQLLVEEGVVGPEDVEKALKSQKRVGEILVKQGKVSPKDIEKVVEKQSQRKVESLKKSISSTIRVDLKKLDHLVNIVGEMVIIHSMLQQAVQGNDNGDSERTDAVLSQLQRIGKDIQESVMSLRMLPVGEVFNRFTRLVRELSSSKNKRIELVITGEDTELDKGVLEKITDPLVHLIRNAIDHGIETAEERTSRGKPPHGTIRLSAYQMGDSVFIDVEDDGRGLDKERILNKAVQKGIVESPSGLTDDQIYNLIFMPGFSTAEKVTDISGRGVGMDVVKRNIEALNGRVFIRVRPGEGTTVSIKLPLTLAIIDGLTVLIGGEVFVIPISSVIESLRPGRENVKTLNERDEVIGVRGEFIPLIRLYEELGVTPRKRDPWKAIVVLVSHEDKRCCLLVDDLIGEQQIVIKSLGTALPKVRGIGGGTILGDGRVALVLDVPGIIERTMRRVIR